MKFTVIRSLFDKILFSCFFVVCVWISVFMPFSAYNFLIQSTNSWGFVCSLFPKEEEKKCWTKEEIRFSDPLAAPLVSFFIISIFDLHSTVFFPLFLLYNCHFTEYPRSSRKKGINSNRCLGHFLRFQLYRIECIVGYCSTNSNDTASQSRA